MKFHTSQLSSLARTTGERNVQILLRSLTVLAIMVMVLIYYL